MSDSDDDSLLDGAPVFASSRKERSEEKARAKGLEYLQASLKVAEKKRIYNSNKEIVTQQEAEFDDQLEHAESLAERAAMSSASKRKAISDSDQEEEEPHSESMATALDTAQSKILGMRSTLGPGLAQGQRASDKDAVEELETILKRLESSKGLDKAIRTAVVPFFRTAIQNDCLETLLLSRKLAPLCRKHGLLHLPFELTEWLYCQACQPCYENRSDLREGAFRTLLALWKQVKGHSSTPLLTLRSMVPDMELWFGLRLPGCSQGIMGKENLDTESLPSSSVNVAGLENFFLLWEQALISDVIPCAQEPVGDEAGAMADSATECMVALFSAGLDPCFSNNQGFDLIQALQRVKCALLDFVSRKLVTIPELLEDCWIQTTAAAALEQCRQLQPSESTSQHQDDNEFYLSTSLMVVSMFDRNVPLGEAHHKFRACMAIRALQMCLGIADWDLHLQSVLSKDGNTALAEKASSSLRWRAIASGLVGFLTIPSLGDDFIKNGQRCLATIENITYCALTGINLKSDEVNPNPEENEEKVALSRIYGSKEEAALICQVMKLLESDCHQLQNQMRIFASNTIFGRAEYHLSCLRGYYGRYQAEAGARAGQGGTTVSVQRNMAHYFGRSQGSDDEDDE